MNEADEEQCVTALVKGNFTFSGEKVFTISASLVGRVHFLIKLLKINTK